MKSAYRYLQLLAVATAAGTLFGNNCIVDDFWASTFSEAVNRLIFGAINTAIGQPGAI